MALWLFTLWACSGADGDDPATDDLPQTADTGTTECVDTWESFGRDFLLLPRPISVGLRRTMT